MEKHADYPMWSALLRWSLKQQDGTSEGAKALSEADRRFLEGVIKDVTVDEATKVGELLKSIDEGDDDGALGELEELVERLDFARDLCKIGGMQVLLKAVGRGSREACSVVATAAQNDVVVQEAIFREDGLRILVEAFDKAPSREALAAMSALVRGGGKYETDFVESGTAAYVLATALKPSSNTRLAAKGAFFLYTLLYDDDEKEKEDEDEKEEDEEKGEASSSSSKAQIVEHLEPALRAAVQRSTEPPPLDDDNNHTAVWQLRESATKAIVYANKANPNWLKANLGVAIQQAAKHTFATTTTTGADLDHLSDLVALWRDNILWLEDDLAAASST
mmetsp:Transcript_20318/g.65463  ORF Transcript_20318/g.65463 Transcript_20318/m.65463 type:complete len:335 (+) Transcript_20318:14-1018(+)